MCKTYIIWRLNKYLYLKMFILHKAWDKNEVIIEEVLCERSLLQDKGG